MMKRVIGMNHSFADILNVKKNTKVVKEEIKEKEKFKTLIKE